MSIRHGLLTLLAQKPQYGYELRAGFEAITGATWTLNIGQVYSTLSRLDRDGLVVAGESDAEGRVVYEITEAGRAEVERWFAAAVSHEDRPRDELAIKLALAVTTPGVDITHVTQVQRNATLRRLQEVTRLKACQADADGPAGHAWMLVRERMIFDAEAEIRWLDHCEAFIARSAAEAPRSAPAPAPAPAPDRDAEMRS